MNEKQFPNIKNMKLHSNTGRNSSAFHYPSLDYVNAPEPPGCTDNMENFLARGSASRHLSQA